MELIIPAVFADAVKKDGVALYVVFAESLVGYVEGGEGLVVQVLYLLALDADDVVVGGEVRVVAGGVIEHIHDGYEPQLFEGLERPVNGREGDIGVIVLYLLVDGFSARVLVGRGELPVYGYPLRSHLYTELLAPLYKLADTLPCHFFRNETHRPLPAAANNYNMIKHTTKEINKAQQLKDKLFPSFLYRPGYLHPFRSVC